MEEENLASGKRKEQGHIHNIKQISLLQLSVCEFLYIKNCFQIL